LLVSSVLIDAELVRENHGSIPHNCDRNEAQTTWCQNWPPNQIKLVVKKNSCNKTSRQAKLSNQQGPWFQLNCYVLFIDFLDLPFLRWNWICMHPLPFMCPFITIQINTWNYMYMHDDKLLVVTLSISFLQTYW
jgi:hypothetical protein